MDTQAWQAELDALSTEEREATLAFVRCLKQNGPEPAQLLALIRKLLAGSTQVDPDDAWVREI